MRTVSNPGARPGEGVTPTPSTALSVTKGEDSVLQGEDDRPATATRSNQAGQSGRVASRIA